MVIPFALHFQLLQFLIERPIMAFLGEIGFLALEDQEVVVE